MSPSAIVCCFIITACILAGQVFAGAWMVGAALGTVLAVAFMAAVARLPK
jgi:hypothetical protein